MVLPVSLWTISMPVSYGSASRYTTNSQSDETTSILLLYTPYTAMFITKEKRSEKGKLNVVVMCRKDDIKNHSRSFSKILLFPLLLSTFFLKTFLQSSAAQSRQIPGISLSTSSHFAAGLGQPDSVLSGQGLRSTRVQPQPVRRME